MTTRRSLGASFVDLWRLVYFENLLLSMVSTAMGLILTHAIFEVVARIMPKEYTILGPPAMTLRVFVLACCSGMLIAVIVAIINWVATMPRSERLLDSAVSFKRGRIRSLRRVLLVMQCAVAMCLLAITGLLFRSYGNLVMQDTGLDGSAFAISVLPMPGQSADSMRADISTVIEKLHHLPMVNHAAASIGSLVDQMNALTVVNAGGDSVRGVALKFVTDEYFEALGNHLVTGRGFFDPDSAQTAIVNQCFANEVWSKGNAIGQVVSANGRQYEVIGIAKDMFDRKLDRKPVKTIFLSMKSQSLFAGAPFSYIVSLRDRKDDQMTTLRREIERASPMDAVLDVSKLEDRLFASVQARSFVTFSSGLFALTSLLVCLTGLWGVVAFTVARRTHEIAIRMALGSTALRVRVLVMREVLSSSVIGILVGILTAAWLSNSLASFLYEIPPADPVSLVLAVIAMSVVIFIAAWCPAERAARLQPSVALRME